MLHYVIINKKKSTNNFFEDIYLFFAVFLLKNKHIFAIIFMFCAKNTNVNKHSLKIMLNNIHILHTKLLFFLKIAYLFISGCPIFICEQQENRLN